MSALEASDRRQLEQLRATLVLSAPTLLRRPAELAAQLVARLVPDDGSRISALLEQVYHDAPPVWLEPVRASLRGGAMVATLAGHKDVVRALAFTDDDRAVSSSNDRTIRVWDLRRGQELHAIAHDALVASLGISNDERIAVSVDVDRVVMAWDLDCGARRGDPGRCAEGASDVTVDVGTGPVTVRLQDQDHDGAGRPRAMSADGQIVVTGTGEVWAREKNDIAWGTVEVEDRRADRHVVLRGHRSDVEAVTVSRDGTRAVSRDNRVAWIWDLESGLPIQTVHNAHGAIGISPSGLVVTSESTGTLRVWRTDVEGPSLGHSVPVEAVAISESAGFAVSIADHGQEDLWVWDLVGTAQPRHRWTSLAEASAVSVSPDGRWAVVGYEYGQLSRYSLDLDPRGKDSISGAGWKYGAHRYEDRDVARISWDPTQEIVVSADGNHALSVSSKGLRLRDFSAPGRDDAESELQSAEESPQGAELRRELEVQRERRRAMASRLEIEGPTVWLVTSGGVRTSFTIDGSRITAWDARDETIVLGDDTGRVHALRRHL